MTRQVLTIALGVVLGVILLVVLAVLIVRLTAPPDPNSGNGCERENRDRVERGLPLIDCG